MEDVLCDISAFRYHRVPPQVLMLLPMVPAAELDRNRRGLVAHPLVAEIIGAPVHMLAERPGRSETGGRVSRHVWSKDFPSSALWETVLGIEVASPLFTLLTLAPSVSEERLAMAVYEFCGTFTVFGPSAFIGDLLDYAEREHLLNDGFGWKRCVGSDGQPTDLWNRPPLIELQELDRFILDCAGMRGVKKLANAARLVTGVTASPFEVQASMLLGSSVRCGGEGLHIENNVPIRLNRSSHHVSGTADRVADIVITSEDGERQVIVECQGEAFHSGTEATRRDSDRTTALQAMGYEVILLTYHQIHDPLAFDTVVNLIRAKLGMGPRRKTARQKERELRLRREIFADWELF